jgi:hypothetical protein
MDTMALKAIPNRLAIDLIKNDQIRYLNLID